MAPYQKKLDCQSNVFFVLLGCSGWQPKYSNNTVQAIVSYEELCHLHCTAVMSVVASLLSIWGSRKKSC